jgi:Tfp pilus assembly protein FimV
MTLPEDTTSLNWEKLLALVAQLQHQVRELQHQVAQLAASNAALQAENAELKRGAKRQAAPLFQRYSGEPAQTPQPPAWGGHLLLPPGTTP